MNVAPGIEIEFPTVLYYPGYIYVAKSDRELCETPRSLLGTLRTEAIAGKTYMLDASGRCFDVVDYIEIAPFGVFRFIPQWISGSVFTMPVLVNAVELSLPDFQNKVVRAVLNRYRHDIHTEDGKRGVEAIMAAKSYRTVLEAVPR
jgi:hypothetical protein